MHRHEETVYFDSDSKIFAVKLTKVTTTWTLHDLMIAAGIPSGAKVSGHWHYDDYGDEHQLSPDHVVLERVQYYNEKGRPVHEVRVEKTRKINQTYYETQFQEMSDAEFQAANESRKAE